MKGVFKMKDFKIMLSIIGICLFTVIIGALMFGGSGEMTMEEFLSENTSYEWKETLHYNCIGAFDEMVVFETVGNEFQLTVYFNNDEIMDARIIANEDEAFGNEMEIVMEEIEQCLDITFWYEW